MASTYLSKSSYGTPTSTKIFTFSCWVKKAKIGSGRIFDFYSAPFSYGNGLFFTGSDQLGLGSGDTGNGRIITNRVFRDTSAWYHIVAVQDTTNATASDRLKLYVNGERETSFSASVDAVLNAEYQAFRSDVGGIGTYYDKSTSSEFFDGEMAHVHFIDGTAYDADTFGETDATTGIWKPKTAPSVTYGTNGFFLKFENSGAFGTDSSGNANNFTVNGTMTQTIDTPSNVFATMNPLNSVGTGTNPTFSNGNLKVVSAGGTSNFGGSSTLGVTSGKWYIEAKATVGNGVDNYSRNVIGVTGEASTQARSNVETGTNSNLYYRSNTNEVILNGITEYTASTYVTNDIIQLAIDMDNLKVYFGKNGTWLNSGVPTSGATGTGAVTIPAVSSTTDGAYFIFNGDNSGVADSTSEFDFNFGNGYFGTVKVSTANSDTAGIGEFEYEVPDGYYSICTKNINLQEYD